MRYFHAYQFLFKSPRWGLNILAAILAGLVPIAGAMVLLGYEFDIIEALHLRGEEEGYPDFDFNRLIEYLLRGAWPFLVLLILSIPLLLLLVAWYLTFMIGMFVVLPKSARHTPDPTALTIWLVLVGAGFVLVFLTSLVIELVAIPMSLRAGLSQEFRAAFSWTFIWDFIRRMWLDIILVELFLGVSGTVLILAGMLLFFVGVYPAGALVGYARCHLWHQLYEVYLDRGGIVIPLTVKHF